MGAEVWILLAASALALQIVTVVMRREHKAELPYLALVAVDLAVLVFVAATHREASLAGKVAASLAGVMVLAPRFIERWERNAFGARRSGRGAARGQAARARRARARLDAPPAADRQPHRSARRAAPPRCCAGSTTSWPGRARPTT